MAFQYLPPLDRTGMLKVGLISSSSATIDLPDPSDIQVTLSTLDSDETTRNSSGDLSRDVIGTAITLSIQFPSMNEDDMKSILSSPIDQPLFKCRFRNPKTATYETKIFYVSDRVSAVMVKLENGEYQYAPLSLDFIQAKDLKNT